MKKISNASALAEAQRLLSKDEQVGREPAPNVVGMARGFYTATWDAYERGFLAAVEWVNSQQKIL